MINELPPRGTMMNLFSIAVIPFKKISVAHRGGVALYKNILPYFSVKFKPFLKEKKNFRLKRGQKGNFFLKMGGMRGIMRLTEGKFLRNSRKNVYNV